MRRIFAIGMVTLACLEAEATPSNPPIRSDIVGQVPVYSDGETYRERLAPKREDKAQPNSLLQSFLWWPQMNLLLTAPRI